MANPLRFRYAPGRWDADRVGRDLRAPLDANLGARSRGPWYAPPEGYEARRFEMDDGSLALFCRTDDGDAPEGVDPGPGGYWLGNTETPEALWRTEKYGFDQVPYAVRRWSERELLATMREESPWLAPYDHVAWFFLPVLCSKDGAETTRQFFRSEAAGFPDSDSDEVLSFYESLLSTGVLDDHRGVMAAKLGTSPRLDRVRMAAAMSEFHAAGLLDRAGYDVVPEAAVSTGHSLDFRVEGGDEPTLVEVTRPVAPGQRSAGSPAAALRDTVATKTGGQLADHGGGVTLFVDCSSFSAEEWASLRANRPEPGHRPAVVIWLRPDWTVEGYRTGAVPLAMDDPIDWVD